MWTWSYPHLSSKRLCFRHRSSNHKHIQSLTLYRQLSIVFKHSLVASLLTQQIFTRRTYLTIDPYQLFPQRRKSVYNFGGTDIEKIGGSASAKGVKLRVPKARTPSRLGGLGKRDPSVISSPAGSGAEPQIPSRFLTFYAKTEYIFGYVNLIFLAIKSKK